MKSREFEPDSRAPIMAGDHAECPRVAFEKGWQTGEVPAISDFLGRVAPELQLDVFQHLLRVELEQRRKRGEHPSRDEYLARYPEHQAAVAAAFQNEPSIDSPTSEVGLADTIAPAFAASGKDTSDIGEGDQLGRYRLERRLGGGAFGEVFLAYDQELERYVAIKALRAQRSASEVWISAFLNEARTVARLTHPGLVPIYDSGCTDSERPFVVMEYVEGRTLKHMIEERPLSPRNATELLVPIAEAVAYAHQQGFIHRDLKPENILIDTQGRPRVVDFGLAIHESEQRKRAGEYAGTLYYMAPEQVRGETHRLDGRADIWALGVMLYQMVSGRIPFDGESREELADEILHREAKPLRQINSEIPIGIERIWQKCCAKSIADRYSTAADVAADLRAFLAADDPPSAVVDPPHLAGGSIQRIALWTLAGVLTVAALIGLSGWRPWDSQQPAHVAHNPAIAGPTDPKGKPNLNLPRLPLECELDVLVWNTTDPSRRGIAMREPGVLPLEPGDQIRIQAKLSRPLYLYLVWIDSEGAATPIYPWPIGRWNELPIGQTPADELSLPAAADEGWPLVGPAGMESLVLLAREEPLSSDVDLAGLFRDLPAQELQDARSLVWFKDGQTLTERVDRERGPSFFDPQRLDDPLLRTQRELGERLTPYFVTVRAVSFAKRGR